MCSGHLQGRFLAMFCRMIQPKCILEIGTFTGYSALCMAEALPVGGVLHTVECDDELEDFILDNLPVPDTEAKSDCILAMHWQ